MQINHNIRAMVTQHALFQNDNSMTKSLEKLSTGLRINRAQDDAAGLAMSEQMRTQIRGLSKAKRNSQDGQAALQIAEGALAEITNMMQRQKELAVQSANDTLTSTERMYLNDEFQALTKEMDRVAKNTDYNGKNVLLFDVDPNKSFAATKLDPYNKDIAFQEAANVVYKYFGQDLKGGFASLTVTTGGGAEDVNDAINTINKVLLDPITGQAKAGILTDANIEAVLKAFVAAADNTTGGVNLGNDVLSTNIVKWMNDRSFEPEERTSSNMKTVQTINAFLREAQDALTNYQAADRGVASIAAGAKWTKDAILDDTNGRIAMSDIADVAAFTTGTGIGSLERIIAQLEVAQAGSTDEDQWAALGAIFGSRASEGMQADLKAVLGIDIGKMAVGAAKDDVATWQKHISDLKDAYKIYSEKDIATGTAASEILHVGPNYSTGLGGAAANQIKVNYVAVDVKGLGLQAQSIDSREGAQRAIDRLQETIKVISGNRAAIGTYINRLDYTINNIASMEYNIQDAESRIRDTDFATETTNFTRNQIMVQASTSMLAQANSLPQAVLGLLG
ncbi:MAG: hypothetical protein LBC87_12335 [Fibromonadaceae bacterium]|jgi:flagellin-like hook-associated protein FlgL|nr:hypothetical protein [Fibromonadaceae bacterium]